MFSYEQGAALTSSQLKSLNSLQQTALSMVLTSWEDKPADFRGEVTQTTGSSCIWTMKTLCMLSGKKPAGFISLVII